MFLIVSHFIDIVILGPQLQALMQSDRRTGLFCHCCVLNFSLTSFCLVSPIHNISFTLFYHVFHHLFLYLHPVQTLAQTYLIST
jgi:hypothetical protein